MSMFEVWYDHEVIAEFPLDYLHSTPEDGSLVILDRKGAAVHVFAAGEWDAAGVGIVCGHNSFRAPKPDCPRCHHAKP